MFLQKHYSPHSMRHTSAMHRLEAGVPMMAIKNFLGHAHVLTTERYAELSQSRKSGRGDAIFFLDVSISFAGLIKSDDGFF